MAVATHLPVDELGLSLAVYSKLFDPNPRVFRKHLDVTPRAHFDEGWAWAGSNAKVIGLVQSDPEAVLAGSYSLSEARGWFSRLIGLGRSKGATAPDDDELASLARDLDPASKRSADPARAKKLAELQKLVDESLDGA